MIIEFVHFSANCLPPPFRPTGRRSPLRSHGFATAEQGVRQLSPNSAASPTRILADVRWTSSPIKGEDKMCQVIFLLFSSRDRIEITHSDRKEFYDRQ